MEGKHGTKAEAGVVTDTGIIAAELDDDDIAMQLQPLIDAVLVLNKGEKARGAVKIKPAPLVDHKTVVFSSALDAMLKDTATGPQIIAAMDVQQMLEQLDIPVLEGAKLNESMKKAADLAMQNQAAPKPDPTKPAKQPQP